MAQQEANMIDDDYLEELDELDLSDIDADEMTIEQAVMGHLRDKRVDKASRWTIYSHRSRLGHFIRYCEGIGVERVSELTLKNLNDYKGWRKTDGGINNVTLKTQMDTLRTFIKYCERIGAISKGTSELVESPDLEDGENVRDESIPGEVCVEILERLRKYHYGSRQHIVFEICWNTTARRGDIHSLDVDDFDREEETLSIKHRPDEGTTLKKKKSSERVVNLLEQTAEAIADWIDETRPDVTDEYGREPLIATEFGRAHINTIASDIYWVTRPEFRNKECSCKGECPATCANNAYACEDSVSPHIVRKAAITHHLDTGWLAEFVADRADNTPEVIDEHYDQASPEEKAKRRKQYMSLLDEDEDEGEDEDFDGGVTATV